MTLAQKQLEFDISKLKFYSEISYSKIFAFYEIPFLHRVATPKLLLNSKSWSNYSVPLLQNQKLYEIGFKSCSLWVGLWLEWLVKVVHLSLTSKQKCPARGTQ